ncbi:MAG: hypothetical protein NZ455_05525 [Bacteroidia bacterium]|nr:hypothetical protein [Bacteroidia bacterium]
MLRATLTLRCFAALRTAHAPSACLTQSCVLILYLVFMHTFALSCSEFDYHVLYLQG